MKYIASILALAAIILLTCYLGNRTTRSRQTTSSTDTAYNCIDAAESQGYDVTIPHAQASTPTHPDTIWVGDSDEGI